MEISKELAQEYTKIFNDGEGQYTQETDKAYQQPEYGAEGEDAVDPRDPSTFTEEDEADNKEEPKDQDTEDTQEEVAQKEDTEDEDSDEFEEIPQRLIDAGKRRGYSDEKIVQLAEQNPEVLEDLAELQELLSDTGDDIPEVKASQEQSEKEPEKPKDVEKIRIETDLLEAGEDVKNVIKKLEKGYNSMVDRVNELQSTQAQQNESLSSFSQQQADEYVRRVDSFFDQAAKDYPQLGETKNLSLENKEFRQKVHDDAVALAQNGRKFGEALEFVLNAHKGQESEKTVKKKIANDLERRQKKFSARPSHRKTPAKPQSAQDSALKAIEEIQKKNGWI